MESTGDARRVRSSSCWLVYLGSGVAGPPDGDDLTLAAVTGSEEEAGRLLTGARTVRFDRSNMIEDRPFHRTGQASLTPGEERTVHVVVTGAEERQQGRATPESAR